MSIIIVVCYLVPVPWYRIMHLEYNILKSITEKISIKPSGLLDKHNLFTYVSFERSQGSTFKQ
jgi:hypothetical protein